MMFYAVSALYVLLPALVYSQVQVQCECAMTLVEPGTATVVYNQLTDSEVTDRSDCSTASLECTAYCRGANDDFWQLNRLSDEDAAAGKPYGTVMCETYGEVIDPRGSGYPLYTFYRVTQCGVTAWMNTQGKGVQHLCCERDPITGLKYQVCELPPPARLHSRRH